MACLYVCDAVIEFALLVRGSVRHFKKHWPGPGSQVCKAQKEEQCKAASFLTSLHISTSSTTSRKE